MLACWIHLTFRTPKAVKDKDNAEAGSGLQCRQCCHAHGQRLRKPVSRHEADAWQVISARFTGQILVEIRILGKNWGAADVWLPWLANGQRLDLIIMIDGEKHFAKGWGEVSVAEQKRVDSAFNAECWKQNRNLLRLYSDDKHEWGALITAAVQKAQHNPMQKFQQFSSKYASRTSEINRSAYVA